MRKQFKSTLLVTSLVASFATMAAVNSEVVKTEKEMAQDKLGMTFQNLKVTSFLPSPVEGMFEINTGSNIIYYYPEKDLLFFGEMYDKAGTNLTAQARDRAVIQALENLPMDSAVTIGDPNGVEIIEFTDPECPYCIDSEPRFQQLEAQYPIKRKIVFSQFNARPTIDPETGRVVREASHPFALKKMEHIICSENQTKAYHDVMSDVVPLKDLKTCDKATAVLQAHQEINDKVGIKGTPTFIVGSQLVEGLGAKGTAIIKSYLEESK
ncbi:DsbC family protein [Vibrio harveyi]|uniref:DsbC family protein n=1 Tax=Vibrio harveyi TaxID=669 RepID=UPI003BB7A18B